ncbi:glucose 1-dehydrogenase [Tsuneonella sp. YG55]|uniref:Glucose 1-dehydrogenase n=1 Tax=Tsuneonella litorea TaxID=2976475 RepID=A0A9X2W2A8_9SPHN|nr:glucose 1-dehydrogenase [Tsuneonella litorea]MCT2558969.1 glucose 1-dehydrogenase [Tsuneonella litorea]
MGFAAPSFDLTGRVAVVTGGNRGIGRSIALGLASAGASVAILARDANRNAAVEEELEAFGQRAFADTLDLTDRSTLGPAMEHVEAALGPVDILVNNAGTADISGGILSQDEEAWDAALAIHLTATMLLSRVAASSMKERRGGKIVNLASMYAIFGAGSLPSYGAAKGGVVQLTKAMAVELAPFGIQVNAIAPGWIATEMTAVVRDDAAWSDMHAMLMARTPAGRWGDADECAGAAIFLASDAARFVTGVMLPVDGGYSIAAPSCSH